MEQYVPSQRLRNKSKYSISLFSLKTTPLNNMLRVGVLLALTLCVCVCVTTHIKDHHLKSSNACFFIHFQWRVLLKTITFSLFLVAVHIKNDFTTKKFKNSNQNPYSQFLKTKTKLKPQNRSKNHYSTSKSLNFPKIIIQNP